MVTSMNLREEVPVNIVRWANLESTMNDLFNNFEAWEQRNAELVNKFFDQPYFRWEESLINKLIEINPNIPFDDIKDEWVNLALLLYDKWMWEFNDCLSKITNDEIKRAFIQKIHDKVLAKIWVAAPYDHFNTDCPVPWDTNVLWYFQKVVDYLNSKESASNWKKTINILKGINVTNGDLNSILTPANRIPAWVELTHPTVPVNTRDSFDILLSFEIGKEADRTVNISKEISWKLNWLFSNTFPAANTIISENDELKYDESKLWDEYQWRAQTIRDDTNLSDEEKEKQINDLKWNYYLGYVKTKNAKIGNALEQLYNNDFDYSKLEDRVLKDYIDKVVDTRLKMLFDGWVNDVLKLNFWNIDEFKVFCKNLADPTKRNIVLNDTNIVIPGWTTTWAVVIPVEKKVIEWPNPRLKNDINQFWGRERAYDALPLRYEINKTDIDALDITIEDKTKLLNFLKRFEQWDKYIIEWKDVWMLIYLFFVVNNRFPLTEFKSDEQEKIQNLFWKVKDKDTNNEWWENGEEWNNPSNPDWSNEWNWEGSNEWNEGYTPEKFKEDIEKLGPWKFENWSEIWLPMWSSELPGGWYQWMKVKLSNIDMKKWTFKWKIFWWELKFGGNLEWKSKEFKMNEKFFNDLKKISRDSNKIWLQPNPDNSSFNSFRESLKNKLWTSELSFPIAGVKWDGSKFLQKVVDEDWNEKEVEVKYFWAVDDDKSTYKVEYNPIRWSFTVSSTFNWDEKDKDWKSKKRRFSYKRDMDWNNFLIFFTQKWLVPQTEDEAKDAVARQDQEFKMVNGGHWTLNWFSFNNIKNWLKDIFGAIKKKIDEYDKSQTEKFKSIVESPILDAMSKLPLPPSVKYAIWERQQEIYNERDSAVRKKIEWYLKVFQADPDFWTTFENLPPHIKTQSWVSLQQTVLSRVQNAKDRMWDPWLYQAAALLLANIEKWWSPYRWLSGKENSGLWVKALLGKAHYEQFMRDKQKCINDLKNAWKEKDQIQDVLATCEMDYIINNVSWANWKLKYFGCHEWRWIPGEEGTNYIDNPSKRLLSNQFADKLKWAYKWWFNKSSVEEAFGKISHNDFNLAKEDFKRLIKSSRFPWALGNLKKMFLLAKNDEQKAEYQKCFLIYMLSGILDFNGKKDLRKQTYLWAKTMWFLPWMLAKNTWHSQQVAALLDDWSGWDFSRNVKSFFRESDLRNWEVKIWKLIEELDWWWDVNKMLDFERYAKSEFPTKNFAENSTLGKLQKSALDTWMENMDNSLLDNPLVANSGWLLSNANVVRDRMAIRDWSFDWKDPDERNNRAEFWSQIAKEVNNMNANDSESVNLVLNQYFSWFGLNSEADRQKAYKWIKTAYFWRDKIGQRYTYDYNGRWQYLDMWTVSMEEINDILWYTFQWTVWRDCFSSRKLPSEMEKALISFQNFFKNAFDSWMLNQPTVIKKAFKAEWINIEPMLLWSRDVYKDVLSGDWESIIDDTEIWDNADEFRDSKKRRKAQKRAFQSWRFINYEIAQIEKSFKNRLPSGSYRVITQDTSSDIQSRINWLNAA